MNFNAIIWTQLKPMMGDHFVINGDAPSLEPLFNSAWTPVGEFGFKKNQKSRC